MTPEEWKIVNALCRQIVDGNLIGSDLVQCDHKDEGDVQRVCISFKADAFGKLDPAAAEFVAMVRRADIKAKIRHHAEQEAHWRAKLNEIEGEDG